MGIFDRFQKQTPVDSFLKAVSTDPSQALRNFEAFIDAALSVRSEASVASTRSPNYIPSYVDGTNLNDFIQRGGYVFNNVDEMLKDESIFAILELKKQFVLSSGYKFSGPPQLVEFLETNINNYYDGLLQEDLYQVQSAYEYGFSLSEKVFQIKNSKMYLKRIKTVPPHSIDYYTDQMGKLERIIQRQSGRPDTTLPIDKMLLFVNIPKFDNPYGTSDLERCYRAWLAKQMTIKFWNIYLQRFASPFPVAKVEDTFGTGKVNKMLSLLDSIQQAVSIVIPKSADIELFKVGNSSGEYDKAVERYNQMIARALLLPDLVGFGQTTQGGSYSLGEQQFDLFRKVCDFNRMRLTELLNEKVFKPLQQANFGEQNEYAKFHFKPYDSDQMAKGLESFYAAIDKGMPTTLEDWNHIRDNLKFPNIQESDLMPTATPPLSPQDLPSNPVEPAAFSFAEVGDGALWREPTKYESRCDFINQQNEIDDMIQNTVKRASDRLKDSRDNLKEFLSRRNIITNSDYAAIDKLRLKYMGDLRIIFQRDFQDALQQGMKFAKQDLLKTYVDITDPNANEDELLALAIGLIGQRAFNAVGNINDRLLNKIKQIIQVGMEQGSTINQINQQINEAFNEVVEGTPKAGLPVSPNYLDNVVRTNMMTAYNLGRKQVYQTSPFVEMYQYSAILDDRTTEICRKLDRKIYPKDSPIWNSITPPNHYNCRSIIIPVTTVDIENDNITPSEMVNLDSLRQLHGSSGFLGG